MSLAILVKGPEGIVLVADSRFVVAAKGPAGQGFPVVFDGASNLLSLPKPHTHVGILAYGGPLINGRTVQSYLSQFEASLPGGRLPVREYAARLSDFFSRLPRAGQDAQSNTLGTTFLVGGYDPDAAYGSVFGFEIPTKPNPAAQYPGDGNFGMLWGGDTNVVSRIIQGFDPALPDLLQKALELDDSRIDSLVKAMTSELSWRIPWHFLPIHTAVGLATMLVRMTMSTQSVGINIKSVGGPTDVATVTRMKGLEYVRGKRARLTPDLDIERS